MRLGRAVIISIGVTVVLTLVLTLIFGPRALGLFLFLPLSFAFGRKKSDREPIEPR
jgi:hypothetical protein